MQRTVLSLVIASVLFAGCSQPQRQAESRAQEAREDAQSPREEYAPPAELAAPSSPSSPLAAADAQLTRQRMVIGGSIAPPAPPPPPAWDPGPADRENYAAIDENPIHRVSEQPVSTFSIDVDTGAYANVRRMLNQGRLPPADAVRAEELINYFDYGYAPPGDRSTPFSVTTEIAPAPWNSQRQLLLVGIKGYEVPKQAIPAANIVYLVDTSGSMNSPDKIELLKQSFRLMTRQLRPQDRVAIVAYAGSAGLVLPSTPGSDQASILSALDRLAAGGSTNGGAGLELAYSVAQQHFIEGGVNRVILASDGDFNVGYVGVDVLKTLIADKRKSGVGLTVLGFGGGNLNDHLAEQLANTGNGNYFYIDTLNEGRKVLVEQMSSTVLTIAEDVKIQIEFNPALVQEYRLIGYENRLLAREDFNNDQVDAGEIGAGHNVTALYEITLTGSAAAASDPLRYGNAAALPPAAAGADELAFLRLRYKQPGQTSSELIETPIRSSQIADQPSERLRFAAAVAGFADHLRGGKYGNGMTLAQIGELAASARGDDAWGYRAEFAQLIGLAGALSTSRASAAAAISGQ